MKFLFKYILYLILVLLSIFVFKEKASLLDMAILWLIIEIYDNQITEKS